MRQRSVGTLRPPLHRVSAFPLRCPMSGTIPVPGRAYHPGRASAQQCHENNPPSPSSPRQNLNL